MELFIHKTARISGDVKIGEGSVVFPGARIIGDHGQVRIGKNAAIEDNCILTSGDSSKENSGSARGLEIGDNVIIGHGAVIEASKIGSHNLIGMKSTIKPCCEIGDFCIIAAGAFVERGMTIPSSSVVAGAPAKLMDGNRQFTKRWTHIPSETRTDHSSIILSHLTGDGKVTASPSANIHPTAVLVGNVEIGAGSVIESGVVIRGDFGKITIGKDSIISENSVLHAGDPEDINRNRKSMMKIGDRVVIGRNAVINGNLVEDDVVIEDDVFVLHCAVIRRNCTILAGSGVMTGMEVPSGRFVSGIPGRILEHRP